MGGITILLSVLWTESVKRKNRKEKGKKRAKPNIMNVPKN
jgi:hypothetical protein